MSIEKPNFNNSEQRDDRNKPKSLSKRRFLKDTSKFAAGAVGALLVEKATKEKRVINKAKEWMNKTFARIREEIDEQAGCKKNTRGDDSYKEQQEELREHAEIKNISDHYFLAFQKLSHQEKYFPAKVFTKDFFIAQQLQESGFDKKAKSKKGAVGAMQLMSSSIKDVSRYLRYLHIAGEVEYNGPVYLRKPDKRKYKKGSKKYKRKLEAYYDELKRLRIDKEDLLTDEDIENIKEESMNNADYSRAIGKLYLIQLMEKRKNLAGYNVGRREYENGDIREARKLLLACYNAGIGNVYDKNQPKPESKWPKETRRYVKSIFNYMERIKKIRQEFVKNGLDPDWDYAVMNVARTMNEVGNIHGKARQEKLAEIMNNSIMLIRTEQERKEKISNNDLNRLFAHN